MLMVYPGLLSYRAKVKEPAGLHNKKSYFAKEAYERKHLSSWAEVAKGMRQPDELAPC